VKIAHKQARTGGSLALWDAMQILKPRRSHKLSLSAAPKEYEPLHRKALLNASQQEDVAK
jgi:hypothetical protein